MIARREFSNKEAIRFYIEELELMEDNEEWLVDRLRVLDHLGDVQELVGDYSEAIKNFRKIRELTNDKEKVARTHRMVGLVLLGKGEYDKSLEELQKGIDILVNEKNLEYGRI